MANRRQATGNNKAFVQKVNTYVSNQSRCEYATIAFFQKKFWPYISIDGCNKHSLGQMPILEYLGMVSSSLIYCNCEKKLFQWSRIAFLKLKAEGREFASILRSLEQFMQTVKDQQKYIFWNRMPS